MKFEFFLIPVSDSADAAAELNVFLAQKRVVTVDKHLVQQPSGACWSFCVEYHEPDSRLDTKARLRRRVDYRQVLSEEDFEVFAAMRRWRKEVTEQSGTPAYQVFTNEQLATVVRRRVRTLEGLALSSLTQRRRSRRLEARHPRRSVELERTERARGIPQCEPPREPQEQPGLPPGPSSGDAGGSPDPISLPSRSAGHRGRIDSERRCVSRAVDAAATAHRRSSFFVPFFGLRLLHGVPAA